MISLRGCAICSGSSHGAASNAGAQIFSLPDGTPVRLRLMKTVSSAEAKVGETVDFEVTEPVISNGMVVIPKGSLAWGKVTKVEPKKRFGRGGELEVERGIGPAGGRQQGATARVSGEGYGGYERRPARRDHCRVTRAGLGEGQGRRVPERSGEHGVPERRGASGRGGAAPEFGRAGGGR